MARDGSGTYSLPGGTTVAAGTTIESSWANTLTADLEDEVTNSLDRSGRGGMTGALKCVDGTVGAPGITFGSQTNTGLYRAGSGDVRLSIAGADMVKVTASGLTCTQDITAYSDERLKRDIEVIGGALETIGKVRGVTFTRIDRPLDGKVAGVIAQDVLAALPQAVRCDDDGILSVSHAGMIGLLVAAVNELREKVARLEAK